MDLLRLPWLGRILRWRHARTALQVLLLSVAIVIVLHGFIGPDIGSANLSTVLIWVHYRGLLVVALLAAGNVFCAGCPMIRVRDWGRKLHVPTRHWPRWVGGKWLAIVLFAAVLFAYELFDLWALPGATAWLVLGYFGAALLVDLIFRGASFCSHVCPVGQFNFIASTISPLEVRVRDVSTCDRCTTHDCVAGRRADDDTHRIVQRGCELGLFLPAKVGNLDCTFCLDCVHACPHDNVVLASRAPALELTDTRRRSVIGRLASRNDVAVLAGLFVFASLVNAFAMVRPARQVEQWIAGASRIGAETFSLGVIFVVGIVVAPAVVGGLAAALTNALTRRRALGITAVARRYVFALVPFGIGMWTAHYLFHLLTGILVVVPVTQSAAIDLLGTPWLGEPLWRWSGLRPGSVFPIQLGLITLGAIGSLGLVAVISEHDYPGRSMRASMPWMAVVLGLVGVAIWVLYQPMDMRGLGAGG